MARGRPPKPRPDGANLSRATFLEIFDDAHNAKIAMDSARGKYQAIFKKAETLGINRAALSRALKESARERDKREIDHRDLMKYMAWLEMPLGAQGAFDLGDAAPNGHDPDADEGDTGDAAGESEEDRAAVEAHKGSVAYHQGHEAGKLGANVDSCPFLPGTEDNWRWHSGWQAGQAEAVSALAPAKGRRARKPAAGQSPAGEA